MAAFLFSCISEKSEEGGIQTSENDKIKVRFVGEISARRTFADIQFIEDEKEKEAYIEKQEKSNPVLMNDLYKDQFLISQFERHGLVKYNELVLTNFKFLTDSTTQLTANSGELFHLRYFYDSITGHTHFKVYCKKDSLGVDTGADPLQNMDYVFLDIIPGGNKELVFLDDYYIMLGYNFIFKIYEIWISN